MKEIEGVGLSVVYDVQGGLGVWLGGFDGEEVLAFLIAEENWGFYGWIGADVGSIDGREGTGKGDGGGCVSDWDVVDCFLQ